MIEPVEVIVQGPGHHDRAAEAVPLIAAVSTLDVTIVVSTDLRPRLAVDMRALLDAGADAIRLEADGIAGELIPAPPMEIAGPDPDPESCSSGLVRFVLRAGPRLDPRVTGSGELAVAVRAAIDAGASPAGSDG